MFDYLTFRAAAYKYKYDTAIKTQKKSVTYGELSQTVGALSNALANMQASGRALVLMENGVELVASCLALSKSGLETAVASPFISKLELCALCKAFTPDVVFVSADAMVRLATTFSKLGCTCAVVDGNLQNVLPQEFEYSKLIKSHDYEMSAEPETSKGVSLFADDRGVLSTDALEGGELIDAPMWEKSCCAAVSALLYEGKSFAVLKKSDKRSLRKNGITSVLTTESAKNVFAALLQDVKTVVYPPSVIRTGERLLDTERMSRVLTAYCKAPVTMYLSGVRVHIEITVTGELDKTSPESEPAVALLKSVAADAMYATACPKTFAVRQKSV